MVEPGIDYLRIGREQLLLWVRGVAAHFDLAPEKREEAIYLWLLEHDPHYRNIKKLPDDIYRRERIFLDNTLKGMLDYVERLDSAEQRKLAAGA